MTDTQKTQHPPGPWYKISAVHETGKISWLVGGAPTDDDDGREMLADTGQVHETARANARLMAAAPDLLNAMQGILPIFESWIQSDDDDPETAEIMRAWVNDARSAIAKATGAED